MAIESIQKNTSKFTKDQIELIKRTICDGATDDELSLFLYQCNRTGLDPFAKQIHAVKRKAKDKDGKWVEKFSHQIGIDGFRLIADRTNKYRGTTEALWCGIDGIWVDVWLQKTPPLAAKIGVRRVGFDEPVYSIARLDSYAQKFNDSLCAQWKTMPDVMLAKCAEALSLRKAFPCELSGLYTEDEMGQIDNVQSAERLSEAQVKDVAINQDETKKMHLELIESSKDQKELFKNYMSAIGFARSIKDPVIEKTFMDLKDMVKNSFIEEVTHDGVVPDSK